jgi:hypothetical protein
VPHRDFLHRLRPCFHVRGVLPHLLERLVRLYEATGDKEQAAKWRKKLEEAEKATAKAPKK